ncbi:uncharacterized protein LOC108463211 [Gossypium arboreum]|uniref:uncharacterized protein LOC108463211 n=1 Tax=Gossypium arboreum TaxID=29729 RepID=UPI0008192E50|nr:uncharacterized protein LOC108463211 [Gossypium arboreum]
MIFRISHPIVREFGEFEGGREVVGQNRGFVSLGTLDFLQQLQLEGCYLLLKESYFVTGPLIRTVGGLNFFHIFIIVIVLLILANSGLSRTFQMQMRGIQQALALLLLLKLALLG